MYKIFKCAKTQKNYLLKQLNPYKKKFDPIESLVTQKNQWTHSANGNHQLISLIVKFVNMLM